jgi:diaminobutyrate-2-oxoglutarate transaminase
LVYGFEIKNDKSMAGEISKKAFQEGLIVETCGSESQVVKFLPPLLIEEELLKEGLKRFEIAVDKLIEERSEHLKGEY